MRGFFDNDYKNSNLEMRILKMRPKSILNKDKFNLEANSQTFADLDVSRIIIFKYLGTMAKVKKLEK